MDISEIKSRYRQITEDTRLELSRIQTVIYRTGTARLLLFVACVAGIIVLRAEAWYVWGSVAAVTAIPFLLLVKYHNRLFCKKEYLATKIDVNRQELAALDNDFSSFCGGVEFVDSSHLYTFDLDVFGDRSLFQSVNRSVTEPGVKRLAAWFSSHLLDREEIRMRQEAVAELSRDFEFRQRFRILGLMHKGERADESELREWAATPSLFRKNRLLRILPYIVAGINLLLLMLLFIGVITPVQWGAVFVILMGCSFAFTGKVSRLQTLYGRKLKILSTYAALLSLVEERDMKAALLKRTVAKTREGKNSSSVAIHRLSRLMDELDWRNNIFVYAVLNALFFWELRQAMRIEAWREEHASDFTRWLEAIGEIDALLSLATFAYNNPDYVYPSVMDGEASGSCGNVASEPFRFSAVRLGHPLIERSRCVRNDIEMNGSPAFIIITGANMAGKSTYLRTVGVNYLLACIGAPVCAARMEVTPVRLVTSLRTSDSLNDNESYFFAELKRLKMIIDMLQHGEKLFVVLDEILKGTNSIDKQKGSAALVTQFMSLRTNGIIATHDLALGALSELFPGKIRNFCFEADITDGELTFSYKLRPGMAQNMNACFLMKKMGIAVAD